MKIKYKETCQYCGVYCPEGHVDHIIPLSKGGDDSIDNLVWSCPNCNLRKGSNGSCGKGSAPATLLIEELTCFLIRGQEIGYTLRVWEGQKLPSGKRVTRMIWERYCKWLRAAGILEGGPGGTFLTEDITISEALDQLTLPDREEMTLQEMVELAHLHEYSDETNNGQNCTA